MRFGLGDSPGDLDDLRRGLGDLPNALRALYRALGDVPNALTDLPGGLGDGLGDGSWLRDGPATAKRELRGAFRGWGRYTRGVALSSAMM